MELAGYALVKRKRGAKHMDQQDLQSHRLDHLGIVAGICNEIALIETIDAQIEDKGRKVSVGQAVQAMILNGLGFVSRPLYLSPEFFHNKPVDLLVGEGIEATDLNDDCLGRALDKLFDYGVTELFASVSKQALQVFGIETRYAHLDSTSFGLHGDYDREDTAGDGEPTAIQIMHGYSRDHRPDLKQAIVSLICANQASLPVWFQALDGNSSDSSSFGETIRAYVSQFTQDNTLPVFVADAALYNAKTLQQLPEGCRIVTRVPGTLKAVKTLYHEIDNADLFVADETTRYLELGGYYADMKQRWLLVLHEPSRIKQDETLQKRIDKERVRIEKQLHTLQNKDFGCADAIDKALSTLTKKWQFHAVETQYYTEKRYQQPGRPTEDTPFEWVWRFEAQLFEDAIALEQIRRTHGKYVVATNELDETQLGTLEILGIYKQQSSSVERGFRFLKDPMFFADSLFLKKPSRIMALLMVMGLSLLIYALAEHQVRSQLLDRHETLPDQTGKPTQTPTIRRVFQMMEGIDLLIIDSSGFRRRLLLNMTDVRWQIVRLFSHHVHKLYDLQN
jgi:transposase